jgi:hypothetical protein
MRVLQNSVHWAKLFSNADLFCTGSHTLMKFRKTFGVVGTGVFQQEQEQLEIWLRKIINGILLHFT